ncbi:MAG: cyanophycinase [Candidatus Eremiobacteraeota bacterium]|nr:cyanophycinase [Candidatus Eremiobacteraeota bacterium]
MHTPAVTLYPRLGSPRASGVKPRGPGLLLMGGGTTVDSSFLWMHDVIAGSRAGNGGDITVLRASGTEAYDDYLIKLAHFNSVRTIKIERNATAPDLARVAAEVDKAQGVFFAGGDQANYARWKDTSLSAAVQRVYDRGGVIGGTSAGLAILGEYVYDSVAADAASPTDTVEVTTKNAIPNPSESIISFTHDLLVFAPLRRVITDTHFVTRNRFGRLAVYLARLQAADPARRQLMGVGVDEATAIVIDKHGIGTLKLQGKGGSALFVQVSKATRVVPGKPFVANGIKMTLLNRDGQTYDFNRWCANGAPTYTVNIDGNRKPIYQPPNPYKAPAGAVMQRCP